MPKILLGEKLQLRERLCEDHGLVLQKRVCLSPNQTKPELPGDQNLISKCIEDAGKATKESLQ